MNCRLAEVIVMVTRESINFSRKSSINSAQNKSIFLTIRYYSLSILPFALANNVLRTQSYVFNPLKSISTEWGGFSLEDFSVRQLLNSCLWKKLIWNIYIKRWRFTFSLALILCTCVSFSLSNKAKEEREKKKKRGKESNERMSYHVS